ncbi:type II secretion system F family protein [Lichenifustis flavocetrariae]|uniref:Type II secretion system F family protein n=1 Tax=Lichenifustis flavocetrariae TaxID=2949735 RepID=A0AA41Z1V1_9HYPH|nr:type II secretion system F family protein [Lichenifustis flavocetrariae]MCW6508830.1 type II secretion system F family protein [Lichenifustis flavocetrariae]
MPSFNYEALDGAGRRLTGTMDGDTHAAVLSELDRAGLLPIRAVEAKPRKTRTWRQILTPEPKAEDITAMTLDIVMLLKGGVTLSEALTLLTQMGGSRWRTHVLDDLRLALSVGKPFSRALAEHPRLFPPMYLKMVEVAEATGRLEDALTSLAEERQRVERLRKRLIGAISYPAFLIVSALSATVFIFLYIIPQFENALEGFRDKVDPTALMVFNASAFLRSHLHTIGMTLGAAVVGLFLVSKLAEGRCLWVGLAGRLPVVKTVLTHDTTLKFCRTLSVLLANDVDISSALRLLRTIIRVPAAARAIDGVIADVRKGRRLSEALESHPFLPKHVTQMLRVGEESGRLADSASRVSVFYEARLDTAYSRLIAVIGPATMMLVSMLIAWLIISVMTALMSVNDLLK